MVNPVLLSSTCYSKMPENLLGKHGLVALLKDIDIEKCREEIHNWPLPYVSELFANYVNWIEYKVNSKLQSTVFKWRN
jgi:hypothetical protein